MRILLTLAYEGTNYAGWQLQAPGKAKPTLQATVEEAIATLTGQAARLHCAGRTDAGVHALDQKAHFDIESPREAWDWTSRLNAVLPPDIRILKTETVPAGFHARKNALAKTYLYQFWQHPRWTPPHLRAWVWACGPLNVEAMRRALPAFTGSHDFASFQNAGTPVKNTFRTIHSIRLEETSAGLPLAPHAPMLRLIITGNGFLKQMARNIAGYLAVLGAAKRELPQPEQILAQASRQALPTPTAPARGLFLAQVHYED